MRAVRVRALLWAGMVAVAGLHEAWAFPAAILGFLLAVIPALFAPKLEEVHDHGGHRALYRAKERAPRIPVNPTPDRPHWS